MSNMDHQFDQAVTGWPMRIGAHPAFPAIVAVWFAALFGFGCMLLPGAMVDGFARALGLGAVSDSFVLPVDFIGRSILAALAGVLGGAGGWTIVRRAAIMPGDTEAPGPRTLDISELTGESRITQGGEQGAPRKRRGTLAKAEGDTPGLYPEPAILPASTPAESLAFDAPSAPAVGVDSDLPDSVAGMERHLTSESKESADLAQREELAVDRAPEPATLNGDGYAAFQATETHEMVDIGGGNEKEAEAGAVPFTEEIPESQEAAAIAFSAPSLSRESHTGETSDCKAPASVRNEVNGRAQFLSEIADADLGNLGTVQLAERLAISIARRRERVAALAPQAPREAPSQPCQPSPSVPVRADHSATATAFESAPEALRPIRFDFDPEEAEEDDLGLSLDTIRHSPGSPLAVRQPRPPLFDDDGEMETSFVELDLEEEEPEDPGENYGSLLATRRELGGEHVRIDEPESEIDDIEPATISAGQSLPMHSDFAAAEAPSATQFPSQSLRRFDPPAAPAEGEELAQKTSMTSPSLDRAEAERSLRGALEALQRVGSAA